MSQVQRPGLGLYIRSALFWIPLTVTTLLFAPLVCVLVIFPVRTRFPIMYSWNRTNLYWLGILCGLKYRVYGRENIPQHAAVVLAKHQSTWETFALNIIFPWPLVWVAKKELLRIPIWGWSLAAMKTIAIDRSAGRSAQQQIISQGGALLTENFGVVLFPEGTRIPVGQKGRYKLGGAVLATATEYPVVPVAHNAGVFWPKGSFIKYPGEISVHIGPQIESKGKTPDKLNKEVEAWIEAKVAELPQAR